MIVIWILISFVSFLLAFSNLANGNIIGFIVFFSSAVIAFKKTGISLWGLIGTLLFIDIFSD